MYPNIPGPPNDVEPFIVGGEESIPNSRPYQVIFVFDNNNFFY